ncbi:MAG: AAA family ATPase [Methylomonas sp.]|nr:AAA family ATPase [Methylomonas sp.]PPD20444.1 MAG: chromosome segregation protein SMC [Methylomonas sp.]PPD26710.1 MAG: chromosome segregation protein SMC [Methylomonas sp.]PPD38530.1 MAG: chromosome segregation protein SMC [Methylomonas sp.]PPD40169.1 MAG: chromosome segregation protein SMC [Methylomonas sp.]
MRILNIVFKNINSLEGEGRVHFDRGPIADSGVFAITGPNGAGKTSILDVITLGLYGETFRFAKPAGHVMTKQTRDSMAQVEFALGSGQRFRSSWHVVRNDDSNQSFIQPQMTLIRLGEPEAIIADTPAQVRSRITELTGMDFHKFSKSIVLPQGDFAAFLNALDSERMDILEKIGGADLYIQHKHQAESALTQARNDLAQTQTELDSIVLLDPAALDAAADDLLDFSDQVEDFKSQQTELETLLANHARAQQLQQQQQQQSEQRRQLLLQIADHQRELQRITDYASALEFQPALATFDQQQQDLKRLENTLASYQRELNRLQVRLGDDGIETVQPGLSLASQKAALDALSLKISELKLELPRAEDTVTALQQQITDNEQALAEEDSWLLSHAGDASLVSDFPDVARLRNLRAELAELTGKQKTHANWVKNLQSALKKNRDALAEAQNTVTSLTVQIERDSATWATLAQGQSLEELKDLQNDQQLRVNDLKQLHAIATTIDKLAPKRWFGWLGRKSPLDDLPDTAALESQLAGLRDEMSREENIAAILQRAVRNDVLINKLAPERSKLVDGEPCFLCGAPHHPYTVKPPVATDAKRALVDQRGKIQTLKSRINDETAQLAAARKRSGQQTAKAQYLQQAQSQWTLLANRLNVMSRDMNIDNLALQKHLLTTETQELEKLSALLNELTQLQNRIDQSQRDIPEKHKQIDTLTAKIAELQATWDSRPADVLDVERRFDACKTELATLSAKLEKQLAAVAEKLPGKGKENPLFDRLSARRQDYLVHQLRQKNITDENQALREKLNQAHSLIARQQKDLVSHMEDLSNQQRVSLQIAVIEKQKLIADAETGLKQAQAEWATSADTLTAKLAASPILNIDTLRELLTLLAREADIKDAYSRERQQFETLERQLTERDEQLASDAVRDALALDISDIQRQLHGIRQQRDIAEQEISRLQTNLDKQGRLRKRFDELQQSLAERAQHLAEKAAEMASINGDPVAFHRKIQQIMIDNLLAHSNRILETLSGRYFVRSAASEHGLALDIEDARQNNVRRLPQTLSGGESFVVSLALALALAEIANHGQAIDSLFLDEGFGNLDAEALYLAMTTLENLKTHGKTVGVISHVDAVKNRIKTQIELVKKANGLSEIRLVA